MSKGQWFLISAVLASASFLTISMMLRGYFTMDSSQFADMHEDYMMDNTMTGLGRIYELSQSDSELSEKLSYFKYFMEKNAVEKGYLLSIENTSAPSLGGTEFIVKISSDRMSISKNITMKK